MVASYLLLPDVGHESVDFIAFFDQPGKNTRSIYDLENEHSICGHPNHRQSDQSPDDPHQPISAREEI